VPLSEVVTAKSLRFGALTGVAGQAVVIGSGVLTQVLAARLLTPALFGAYTLLATVTYIAAATLRVGLHQVVVRATAAALASGGEAAAHQVARRVVFAATLVGAIALPVLALLVVPLGLSLLFDEHVLDGLVFAVAGIVAAEAIRLVVSESFRGLHRQGTATLLGSALRSTLLLLPLVVVSVTTRQLTFAHVIWLMLGASFATLAAATLVFVGVMRKRGAERHGVASIYMAGLPFLITELTAAGLSMGDVVVIGYAAQHEELALYAAASRVAALIAVPAFVGTTALMPVIASLWSAENKNRIQELLRGYGFLTAVPTVGALLLVLLVGDGLLALLFGPFYASGWPYMVVLAAGAAINTVLGYAAPVLMMTGHSRTVATVAVTMAIATVVAELVVVNVWGPLAVAIVAAGGISVQQAILMLLCKKRTGLVPLPGSARRALLSIRGRS
jgi:O-antigen/teichoic acid export membrane protein